MFSSALNRVCRPMVQRVARRNAGGGFPANMGVKKNIRIEEWNGLREITEKTFEFNVDECRQIFVLAFLFPYFIYSATRYEFIQSGERRVQDVI